MIQLLISGKTITLTPLQALDLQTQIIQQLRTTFTPTTLTPTALPPAEDKMITTAEAIELARKEGTYLPGTTLRAALRAGTIPGVQQPAGRKLMPEHQFRTWLAVYKLKG